MLKQVIAAIKPLDETAMAKCKVRLDNLTKPLGSLHSFEHLAHKMAGITGNPRPQLSFPCIVILNGSRRTSGMIEVFAAHVSAEIIAFDMNADKMMNKEQMAHIMEKGIKIACSAARAGSKVIGTGMVGAMNPSTVSDICSWYGRDDKSPIDALVATGSPELAGLVGVILGAAAGGAAVVLDGLATSVAALVAVRMAPQLKDYLIGSHFTSERYHAEVMKLLDLPTYLSLGMNVGEGVGAVLGISLIQASLHVLNDMKTFGEAEVHVAEDGPGALVQKQEIRD